MAMKVDALCEQNINILSRCSQLFRCWCCIYPLPFIACIGGRGKWLHFYRRAHKTIYWERKKYLHEWSWTTGKGGKAHISRVCVCVCVFIMCVCVCVFGCVCVCVCDEQGNIIWNAGSFMYRWTPTDFRLKLLSYAEFQLIMNLFILFILTGETHTEQWVGRHQSHQIGALRWHWDHPAGDLHDARLSTSQHHCLLRLLSATG